MKFVPENDLKDDSAKNGKEKQKVKLREVRETEMYRDIMLMYF